MILRVVVSALLLAVPGEILLAAVTGTGDTRATLLIELAVTAVILALAWTVAVILALPVEFVWTTLIAGWLLRGGLGWAQLRRRTWRRLRI